MKVLVGLVLVATVAAVDNYFKMPSPYRYSCLEEKCVREEVNPTQEQQRLRQQQQQQGQQRQQYTTLSECNLVCGQYGSLWPRPSKDVTLSPETIPFLPQNMQFTKVSASNPEVEEMLQEQAHYFQRNLHFMHPDYQQRSKGPFTEYQKEKYNSPNNVFFRQQRDELNQAEESFESVARFDLFNLNHKLRREPSQGQSQRFDSQFRNQDRQRNQMRYEKISPFSKQQASPLAERQNFEIEVTVTGPETQLRIDTDESYDLALQTVGETTTATIIASTYYGARHALESLSQMIAYNELSNSLQVVKTAKISDEPAFKYRGIMLDTGRNYYPKEDILSLMDTMATNKLNTFHWHISDAASFPMYSQRQPQMTYYGAYSPRKVYYPQDIREIVEYANQRGIRVIPELDAPAHAGAGWNFGEKEGMGKLVLCNEPNGDWFENCKEPPCGQLNPTNPKVYEVLKNVYSDILEAFNPEFLHMGGDDTSFKCWSNATDVTNFLAAQSLQVNSQELFKLWNTFQTTAFAKLSESIQETGISKKVTPMIYSSSFVKNFIEPKDYIVQLTNDVNDTNIADYISNGYKVIFSNADAWSFEGPASSWVSQAQTYKKDIPRPSWKQVYENSPLDMLTGLGVQNARTDAPQQQGPSEQVLGGEAMVLSYETDAESLQSTVWPRGAALAERLWTDPRHTQFQADKAETRMAAHRERMVNRGTRAETFQPEYCFQNQNACYSQEEYQFRQNSPQA